MQHTWLGADYYHYCPLPPSPAPAPPPAYPPALPYKHAPRPEQPTLEGCPNIDVFEWYFAAFAWSTMIITGTGAMHPPRPSACH